VAKSAAGKWVSRVGSSGGGKAYKKTRPSNYYGILVVIVVLGLVATVFARYEYQHPASAAKGTPPAVGTTWYAGLSVEVCGKQLPSLVVDPTFKGGLTIQANNVIKISPISSADSGNNATLAQFANEYPGMIASSSELAIPTKGAQTSGVVTYRNGDACPANSQYKGQTGKVSYAYWTSFGQTKPTVTTNPSSIKFSQELRVTMAFDPAGVTPKAPSQTTANAMVQAVAVAASSNGSTTTTTVPSTTTSAPSSSSTTTTAPTTTTTAKG
jgi:hypothetical protein